MRTPVPPFGILWLDPTTTEELGTFGPPPKGGVATLSLTIPDVPAFVGATLHFQGVVVDAAGAIRLTNTTAETIRR